MRLLFTKKLFIICKPSQLDTSRNMLHSRKIYTQYKKKKNL